MWSVIVDICPVTVLSSIRMVLKSSVLLISVIFFISSPAKVSALTEIPPASGNSKDLLAKAPWNTTWTDVLKKTLLVGYDKYARPANHNISTNVSLGISMYHIDLDDKSGVMNLYGWVRMSWNDEKLKWNASEYGNLDVLHLADHEVWQPDIIQYNSATGNTLDQYGNTHCLVYSSGEVLWVPPAKLSTFCSLNLKHWPQDEQVCVFTIGSWTYDGIQLQISLSNDYQGSVDISMISENSEWEVTKVDEERVVKIYPCCPEPYYTCNFRVHVKRRGSGSIRAALLRTPAAVSALLALLSHWLPPSSPRLPLAAAPPTLLSLVLLYLANRLPSSSSVPNIVMFYSISLYITCLSGIVSVIVINMALTKRALPWAIRRILCSKFAKCLHLPKLVEHSTAAELQNTIESESESRATEDGARIISESSTPARDWLALATAIDRIVFIILLLTFVIASIVYCC